MGNGVTTLGVSILHRHSLKIFLKTTVIIFYDILYELHVFGRVFWKNFKVFSTTLCTYFVYLSEAEVYVEQISCVACESHVIFFHDILDDKVCVVECGWHAQNFGRKQNESTYVM